MDTIEFLKANSDDLSTIFELLKSVDLPIDGVTENVENFLLYFESSGVLIGCAGLEIYDNSALLRSVAIHSDYQGRGLGKQLVDGITDYAIDKEIKSLYLLTDTAEKFFRREGYIIVDRAEIPNKVKESVEFTTLCTSSPAMVKHL
ncbi:MAG: GNAT family N-acetyltransferase [Candidatus Heimdallarchaeota archaeon]|nr:GNAT family N-acetyltransferase [Candidatus Heimdallarchaeota archaeon]MCK5049940.1 GNAT family N-acetyltransferase [Candidatus Heimdallarchaeota archaeon]